MDLRSGLTAPARRVLRGRHRARSGAGGGAPDDRRRPGRARPAMVRRRRSGQDAHAGPTPMQTRRNALLAASRLVGEVHRIGTGYSDHARGTVGFLVVKPNSRNVVPGEVRMSVDLRSAKWSTLDAMVDDLRRCIRTVQDECRVEIRLEEAVAFRPEPVRRRPGRERARCRGEPRPFAPRHRQRRCPRCGLPVADRADGDDLRAVRKRDQPQRARKRAAGAPGRRLRRAAACRAASSRSRRRLTWRARIGKAGGA